MLGRHQYLMFATAMLVTGVLSSAAGLDDGVAARDPTPQLRLRTGPAAARLQRPPDVRRLIAPAVGCWLAGLGWWLLRRTTTVPRLRESIQQGRRFAQLPMTLDAALQVLAVGSGASLGREQAPRLFAPRPVSC